MIVRDHGVGIPPTQLGEIFDRFHRIVPSPYHSGLQLGLSITRQIVEAHHGLIRADSEPGAGARFTIELPRLAGGPFADDAGAGPLDGLSPRRTRENPSARRALG
jgi:signal transduction histidine kinase